MAWDGAQKQDAIIAESARGTTPASPTFLLLAAMAVTGSANRPVSRARSRQPHRSAVNVFDGLTSYPKSVDMDMAYEPSLHALLASLFMGAWAANVVKFASTMQPLSIEEKYGATTVYRRTTGVIANSMRMSASLGNVIRLEFGLMGLGETTASSAIAGATYTAISAGKPFTPANIVVNDLHSLSSPKVQAIDLSFSNNAADLHGFGSNDPDDSSLGEVTIEGTVALRFSALAQYTAFTSTASGALDLTFGHTTSEKYRLLLPNACAYGPDISDPGSTGPHTVTYRVMGKYDASTELTAAKLTRAVA